MSKINVAPTAAIIKDMARTMNNYAKELERISAKMIERNDMSLAAEAMSAVTNCLSNMRLDLLVTRPIREYERESNTNGIHRTQ